MTEQAKLEMLKLMVGTSDTDEVLTAYLNIAGRKIICKAYPYDPDVIAVPNQYAELQVEIAVYLLNKRGAEGQLTHAENGISRSYESGDVPNSMLRSVVPFVGVVR